MVLAALHASGAVEDVVAVQELWDRFAARQLGARSPSYHLCYPDDLLDFVADSSSFGAWEEASLAAMFHDSLSP